MSDLTAIWRRHRDSVLFVEEVREPVVRTDGPPAIRRVGVSSLLLPLVRDLLNRGDEGRLMSDHGGQLTSLMVELGGLLRNVACHRVAAGSPQATAEAIARRVRSHGGRS